MSGVFDDHLSKFQASQNNMTQNMEQLKELYTDTPEDRAGQINKAVQGIALAHNSVIGAYETGKAMYNNVRNGRLTRGLLKDQNKALHDKVSGLTQEGKDKLNDVLASGRDKADDIQGKAAVMVDNQRSGDNAAQVTAIKEVAPVEPVAAPAPAAAAPAAAAPTTTVDNLPSGTPETGELGQEQRYAKDKATGRTLEDTSQFEGDRFAAPQQGQGLSSLITEDHATPDLGGVGQQLSNVVNKGNTLPGLATDDTKTLTTANKLSKGLEEGGAFTDEFPIIGTSLEVLGGLTQLGSSIYSLLHKAPGPTTSIDVSKVSAGQIGGNFSQITGAGSSGVQSA